MIEPYHETVIYIRTSTKEQNPLNQLKDCESIRPVNQKTETFVKYTLLEDQQSAWRENKDREAFEKLLKLIKTRKVRNVIVWDVDRVYRDRKKLISFFVLCKAYKCKIYSYRQRWLEEINKIPEPWNEIVNDLMIQIFGWIAEDESNKKSDRIKAAIRIKKGKKVSYKGNKWGRKSLSTFKRNKVLEAHNDDMLTYRQISAKTGVSIGAVHKIIKESKGE